MNSSEIIIQAKNLCKTYNKVKAVNNISFIINKAECAAFLGPNGAGKTTTIKMFYNIVKRSAGDLKVFNKDPIINEVLIKTNTGIVPQEDNLDTDLTVNENLHIYSNYFDISKKKAQKKIDELLDFFELSNHKKSPIIQLSGGMKRRLVIIRSLLNNPKLLLLDEPTIGLDPQARHLIWDKIIELKKRGLTIVLTTHYMDEASNLSDKIFILNKGNIILKGHPQKLLDNHFETYVLETTEINNQIPFNNNKIRYEKHGNRIFFYSNEEKELQNIKALFKGQKNIIRFASLEDLFLKLTGRTLNE